VSTIKYGILGGDYRYKILAELLIKDGYSVSCIYNEYMADTVPTVQGLFSSADILIAPIPCSKDGQNLFLPDNRLYPLVQMLSDMDKNGCHILVGGVINSLIKREAVLRNIKIYDFFDMEEVAVLNGVPTAEGAIQTAMEESTRTIFGSTALVMGYGRCGKILANMLKGIGARVSVTYRRESDRAYISAYGYNPIALKEAVSYIDSFNFIFNTIPALVIDKNMLKKIKRDTVIIDIAQAPGGTDFSYARDLNIKALYCPGLPGRVAPYTAAEVLKGAVINVGMYDRQ